MTELFKTRSEYRIKENADYMIQKIKKGFFNIIIIFGGTRTGKTTLGFQLGKYIGDALKVPFSNEQIFFSTSKLLEYSAGKMNAVVQLDEASFDLKSIDWSNDSQKDFNTYLDTAAKYNQTLIVIIPYLEFLSYRVVRDIHTLGIEVDYNRQDFRKGFVQIYDRYQLFDKYHLLRQKYLRKAESIRGDYAKTQPINDFIDIEAYDLAKDEAIAEGRKGKRGPDATQLAELIDYLNRNKMMTQKEVGQVLGLSRSGVSMKMKRSREVTRHSN